MTELRRGLGARVARLLAGLGVRRERRGKEISKEARPQDRPWGGQSCPDLVQSQGSTSDVSLKVQVQSRSEWDLPGGSHGGLWNQKRPPVSGAHTRPLGRLQRPAVGSTCDLASYGSKGTESLAPADARHSSCPRPASPCSEQLSLGCAYQHFPRSTPEVPWTPEPPGNLEDSPLLPHPVSFPTAAGAKGEPEAPGLAQPQPAQTLRTRRCVRRTLYHITLTLQGCAQPPGEEGEEPAQPDPHPCGPEESRGWQEAPRGLRPITGCPIDPPQEPQLGDPPLYLRSKALPQDPRKGQEAGSLHSGEPDHSVTRTSQDGLPGPHMEETAGPPARAEARVVSATLTWRHRPPAQEETRPRFHKVSLVSRAPTDVSREELFEHSFRREVNGFATKEEETVNYQRPGDEAGSTHFQSHGPIFSKKYTLPPKDKRPVGRPKEAVDRADGVIQAPRTEPPGVGAMARTELLVPLPGPREPSPHPSMGVTSGSSRNREEWRVTRTVRTTTTTTMVGGHVDRRVNSSVTMGPTVLGETLPRGRNVTRTVRAMVVRPGGEGSPSRSQALELLSSLVPAERSSPPPSRLPRPTGDISRGPGTTLGRPLETDTSQPKDSSALAPASIPVIVHPLSNQDVPAPHPAQDGGSTLDARTEDPAKTHRASSPVLPLQTSQDQVPAPSSPQLHTHAPSVGLAPPSEQPNVTVHPRVQPTSHVLPPVKREGLTDPPVVPILPMVRSEVTVPDPASVRRKAALSPESLFAPDSPRNKLVQDSEYVSISTLSQKKVLVGPGVPAHLSHTSGEGRSASTDSSPKPTKVVQGTEGGPTIQKVVQGTEGGPTIQKVVQGTEGGPTIQKVVHGRQVSLSPSLPQKEAVQGPTLPVPQKETVLGPTLPVPRKEAVQGPSLPAPQTSKQDKDVQGSEKRPIPSSAPKEGVQSPAVPPAPSSPETKALPGLASIPAPAPIGTEASVGPQLDRDSIEGSVAAETLREEDEAALTADLEIFLDTLRSMEPPEILRTHRLPRAPRSSYLAMYATLPAIEEDQSGPWMLGPSPQERLAMEEEEEEEGEEEEERKEEEEEEEELENPYLSDDEKLQVRQEKAGTTLSWDSRPARPAHVSYSPLEMMKKHVAGAKGSHPEPGHEAQPSSRPTSRLGGSLLFGSLVPASKDSPAGEPLGAKLSALPPHGAPGVRKVLGQLPLLYSGRPPPEKPAHPQPPEGWSPALKTQGKLNSRPGKVILFSEPGCQGSSREILEDTVNASSWVPVASMRVVRGCWLLYEQPEFQGRKLVLPEGDVELKALTSTWSTQGVGSLRRVVRDYCTPGISLFSEEGLKGEQVKLTEALKDTGGLERPLQVASVTVSAGLWLLYPKPFFEDTPYILEPGDYLTSEAWGASDPSVGSLQPMKLGCPSVEKPAEPKAVVYEAPGFQGRSWEVSRDVYNLQQPEDSQSPQLVSVGSLQILGGCWVGYEKEGFRGHQYLLEEGEYADWSQWGGYDELLTSLRVIRTDFGDPAVVLFEAVDFEGHGVEVSSALPDVELLQHGPSTQAIHVLSGVWVAYEQVGFSGEQYVLEKGVYRNCEDWGSGNSALGSLQPVLQVGEHDLHFVSKIQLFSGPDFLGDHISFEDDQASLPCSFKPQSCRVHGGSWILFEENNFEGDQYILSEGEFPSLTAMGCLASTILGSLRKVPLHFSEPAIFLYGLECFEGKEIELSGEVRSLQAEGFNNHVLSVRIKGGIWVLCEHSDFRGRQWLVGSCEITNWLTYSGTQRVGSLYPIKQRRAYFRLWNAALGGFLAVPDHVEDMKAGRVVVSEPRAGGSCIWYYEDGLLKNQVAPTMSLQVIGPPSPGSKVVLWAESRLPRQTWSINEMGHICSQMFEGQILDVKGGRGYDRDHVVLWEVTKDRPSQIWTIHVL